MSRSSRFLLFGRGVNRSTCVDEIRYAVDGRNGWVEKKVKFQGGVWRTKKRIEKKLRVLADEGDNARP